MLSTVSRILLTELWIADSISLSIYYTNIMLLTTYIARLCYYILLTAELCEWLILLSHPVILTYNVVGPGQGQLIGMTLVDEVNGKKSLPTTPVMFPC